MSNHPTMMLSTESRAALEQMREEAEQIVQMLLLLPMIPEVRERLAEYRGFLDVLAIAIEMDNGRRN